jgi:hypothetical protein
MIVGHALQQYDITVPFPVASLHLPGELLL